VVLACVIKVLDGDSSSTSCCLPNGTQSCGGFVSGAWVMSFK